MHFTKEWKMALPGRIAQKGGETMLLITKGEKELAFKVVKGREGIYYLEDPKELILDGLTVDLVVTEKGKVTDYCESSTPEDVEEVVIEGDDDPDDDDDLDEDDD